MDDFRSFKTARREQAAPMKPLVDPAGWTAAELRDVSRWSYRITAADAGELEAAVAAVRARGVAMVDLRKEDFPLGAFADVLVDVRRELMDGRGIVMMQDFPIDRFDREGTAIAYIGLGAHLGQTMSQNKLGHILGHVKDLGGDYNDPHTRGYMTNAEMRFHTDACDYVGLLCLQTPMSGGASRIASSVTVYNTMLARRPALVEALCGDYCRSRSGEVSPGDLPYFKQPIFSFHEGYFSATGAGAVIDKAQKLPGVPKFTPVQQEAIEVYRRTVDEIALDIDFKRGDIQFLNNFVMLHTRREYLDWPEAERKRHLLRLWLYDPAGRPIPKAQREGRFGRGVSVKGVQRVAPLEAEAAWVETVLYAADGKVGVVTLNRPQKLNALTMEMRLAIEHVLLRADAEEATSVIVLRAEGRSFCVGFDVGGGGGHERPWRHDALKYRERLAISMRCLMTPWTLKKPVIASVQGHALGGGCELAMFCDLTIAAEDALFGEPEILFSQVGPAVLMPFIVGHKRARELIYFGDKIDAKRAHEIGMVNRVVPPAELAAATMKYAKRLSLIAPEALATAKLAVNRGLDIAGFRAALNAGLDVLAPLYAAETEVGKEFDAIRARDGLKAALAWRKQQFEE